jgi:hypothetical protein
MLPLAAAGGGAARPACVATGADPALAAAATADTPCAWPAAPALAALGELAAAGGTSSIIGSAPVPAESEPGPIIACCGSGAALAIGTRVGVGSALDAMTDALSVQPTPMPAATLSHTLSSGFVHADMR